MDRAGGGRREAGLLYLLEATFYFAVGLFVPVAALGELSGAGTILLRGIAGGTFAGYGLQVLDQLLIVLVLVEILHTVRISIRSKEIIIEPFLIVGLIASVRRVPGQHCGIVDAAASIDK